MSDAAYVFIATLAAAFVGFGYYMYATAENLREDVSRVSRFQVECSIEWRNYGTWGDCIDAKYNAYVEGVQQ